MILKMTDRSEMFVDEREGKMISASLTKSTEGFITVRGVTIKKTSISKLEPGGVDPRVSLFHTPEERKALTVGSCRGEYSLAKQLMRIASESKNFKMLGDKQWRAEQEAKLRKAGAKICNNATGECACSPQLDRGAVVKT